MPGHLSALPSRLPQEVSHVRDAQGGDILVEISVKGEVPEKVPPGTREVEASVTTREAVAAGTEVLAAREVEASVTTREAVAAEAEVLAAREVEASVTTREAVAGEEARIKQEEGQEEKRGARTNLYEEGIQARVEGGGGVSLTPQHSSSALFCVFCGEECRDDLAGCHRG